MRVNGNLVVVGQLKDVKIDRLATDPVSPALSQVWFNTTENEMKFYDGTSIQVIATGTGALTEYVKHDGTVAMTGELTLSSADQSAAAATVAVSKGHLDAVAATKQDNLTGATSNLTSTDLAASKAVVSDASGKIIAATNATAAEIEHLAGVTSGIQAQLDGKEATIGYTPLNKAGDSMSGALAMGGNTLSGLPAAVNPTDAVRKSDMDAALAGLDFQPDVLGVQTDNTLDPTATPATGDRYIVTDAANLHANFGTITGVANNDIVEYDGSEFQVVYDVDVEGPGAIAWDRGTSSWVYFNTSWGQFGGLDALNAGIGLVKSGNTIDVNMGAGIAQLPSDEVGIDLRTNGGLLLSTDGSTPSTDTAAQLSVVAGAGMEVGAGGVGIAANGVTEVMLNASVVGNGLQGAAGTSLSVKTFASSGLIVDGTGVYVDDVEMRNRVIYRDGAQAMTGELTLSSSDQSASAANVAVSKGHLDSEVTTLNTTISNLDAKLGGGYFLYEETVTPSTSHVVTHNMNQKYVQVTVVDSSDEVVIPESITYTDANSLTVTFSSSELCRIVVTGLKV